MNITIVLNDEHCHQLDIASLFMCEETPRISYDFLFYIPGSTWLPINKDNLKWLVLERHFGKCTIATKEWNCDKILAS